MNSYYIFKIFFFIFGLLIGSFLNVLIYRLPLEKNIVWPRSKCPNCDNLIKWYQNIPVFSYIFLMGKCANCKCRISPIYPLVELITGFFSLYLSPEYLNIQVGIIFFFYFAVICIFIVHFIIDYKYRILPNSLNLILFIIFLIWSIYYHDWRYWLFGLLIGAGAPLLVVLSFYFLTKKVGMGGGDIKLYGALGLYMGPYGIIYNITYSCMLGSVIGVLFILFGKKGRNDAIAFGPFIIIIATLQIFFPNFFSLINFFSLN